METTFVRRCLPPLLALSALMLVGCRSTVEPLRPEVTLPDQWRQAPAATAATRTDAATQIQDAWWELFQSQELDQLLQRALADSPDLKVAAQRLRQAELQARITDSALFPTLSLSGNTASREARPASGSPSHSRSSGLSLSASYEIDLWGRLAAQSDAASASSTASRHDLATARLTLTSSITTTYFQLLSLRERIVIAQKNLAQAERILAIVAARHRHGAVSQLDLLRQQTTTDAQRSALLPLMQQEQEVHAALAVLVGAVPQHFQVQGQSLASVKLPQVVAVLPATLLTRRPDLAAQEARLSAASANIEAARAAWLPGLSLTAGAGLSSVSLFSLANPASSASLVLSLAQTLFDGGRRSAQTELAESQRIELVENYRKVILTTLKEVDDALGAAQRSARQEALQQQNTTRASQSLNLAELRYKSGADDLEALLDAQRSLFQAQDQLQQLRLQRLSGQVTLIKALGGGWQAEGVPASR